MKLKLKIVIHALIPMILMLLPINGYAHSGILDSLGGHNVITSGHGFDIGTYHYHRGIYAGWIVDNKGDIPNSNSKFTPNIITDNIDNKTSQWAYNEVNSAYKLGLLKGVKNTFINKCKSNITREEFCKLIVNSVQLADIDYENRFVKNNNTFNDLAKYNFEVNIAYKLDIVRGYSEKEFKPTKTITREEMAVMLYRYLEIFSNKDLTKTSSIEDEIMISSWASYEVNALVAIHIIKGTSTGDKIVFSPKNYTTLEQAIILVYRSNL